MGVVRCGTCAMHPPSVAHGPPLRSPGNERGVSKVTFLATHCVHVAHACRSLGILTFEMIVGLPPFYSENVNIMCAPLFARRVAVGLANVVFRSGLTCHQYISYPYLYLYLRKCFGFPCVACLFVCAEAAYRPDKLPCRAAAGQV